MRMGPKIFSCNQRNIGILSGQRKDWGNLWKYGTGSTIGYLIRPYDGGTEP